MKKKLLALVLAVMMTVGCFAGLGAGVIQDADFAALSVGDQYAAIMSVESDEEAMELFNALNEEQQAALEEYAAAQVEDEAETLPVPAVNFTNVAPFAQQKSASARTRMLAKAADTTTDVKTADGLILNKTATANDDGSYNIKLEAYTTGTVSKSGKPVDIVLVLDQSGSMSKAMSSYDYIPKYPQNGQNGEFYVLERSWFGDYYYKSVKWCSDCQAFTSGCRNGLFSHRAGTKYVPKTSASDNTSGRVQFYAYEQVNPTVRLTALKDAVTSFTNSVAEKAKGADGVLGTADDINYRIAVVGFASGDWYDGRRYNYRNSEVFIGSNEYKYGSDAKSVYSTAFQNLNTEAGKNNVLASIGALDANGGTLTNLGMEMANGIFAENSIADDSRDRIVVVFTDGEPGWNGYDSKVADDTITQANIAKNTYGATVYTVGIFENADATSAGNQNGDNAEKANWFMQNLSSNDGNVQDPSYYLSASDANTLKTIFDKISNQISASSIDLGAQTVVKDVVTEYFDIEGNVTASEYDCTSYNSKTGEATWSDTGIKLGDDAISIDSDTVSVTSFDFNANFVAENGRNKDDPKEEGDFLGKKLVIEFTVTPKDGFAGGNNVPTNGTDSGIYNKDGELVANFVVPEVNVPVKAELNVADKVIYKGQSESVDSLYTKVDTNSWKYDFVNVTYDVKQGENAVSGTVTPDDCTDYTVSATFAPKTDGTGASGTPAAEATKTETATIHVLVPAVSVAATDVTKYYGEMYTPDGSNITGIVTWSDKQHEGVSSTKPAPYTGTDLEFVLDKTPFVVPNSDTVINFTVKANGTDITDKVQGDTDYTVFFKTCTLTITKNADKLYGENDSFIFNVTGTGNVPYSTQVVINGTGSVTLTGLPVGDYTVAEDTGWSWRYSSDNSSASVTLSSSNDDDSVTITNKLNDNRWLGDETYVINKCEKSVIRQIIERVLGIA